MQLILAPNTDSEVAEWHPRGFAAPSGLDQPAMERQELDECGAGGGSALQLQIAGEDEITDGDTDHGA